MRYALVDVGVVFGQCARFVHTAGLLAGLGDLVRSVRGAATYSGCTLLKHGGCSGGDSYKSEEGSEELHCVWLVFFGISVVVLALLIYIS